MATRMHFGPQRSAFSGSGASVISKHMSGSASQRGFLHAVRPGLIPRSGGPTSHAGTQIAAKNYLSRKGRSMSGGKMNSHSNVKRVGAVGGVAAIGYGGYKAYQHRGQIKAKASNFGHNVHNAFHSTRGKLGG